MERRRKNFSSLFPLLLIAIILFLTQPALAATYEPLKVLDVGDNEVYALGEIFARFPAGQLQKNDSVILRLPSGFVWTTAGIGSGKAAAIAAAQTTAQWNATDDAGGNMTYGTENFVRVPRSYSGADNGLFKGSVPSLSFRKISANEVMMEVVQEPDPTQECFFYLYSSRVFIESGYRGEVPLRFDASPGSGFADGTVPGGQAVGKGTHPETKIGCNETPIVFAGKAGQRIGAIVINEAVAASLTEGRTLTLSLPANARWGKLDEDSANGLSLGGSSFPGEDGKSALLVFSGNSTAAATLELKDMEVVLEPGVTGELKVRVGGTAGLSGELVVAKIIEPVTAEASGAPEDAGEVFAVFTIGRAKMSVNGVEKEMDVAPYITGGRTYLPLRYAATAFGVPDSGIAWDESLQRVVVKKGDREAILTIGSSVMAVNGVSVTMDAAPVVVAPGRTMLPLRWVAQALDIDVQWDPATQAVTMKPM